MQTKKLRPEQIAKILTAHCIPYIIQDGRVLADDMECFSAPNYNADLTGYTTRQLRDWLGY